MNQDSKAVQTREQEPGSLLILAILAVAAGAATGLLIAAFRLALGRADQLRNLIVGWAHGQGRSDRRWWSPRRRPPRALRLGWCDGSRPPRKGAGFPTWRPC